MARPLPVTSVISCWMAKLFENFGLKLNNCYTTSDEEVFAPPLAVADIRGFGPSHCRFDYWSFAWHGAKRDVDCVGTNIGGDCI